MLRLPNSRSWLRLPTCYVSSHRGRTWKSRYTFLPPSDTAPTRRVSPTKKKACTSPGPKSNRKKVQAKKRTPRMKGYEDEPRRGEQRANTNETMRSTCLKCVRRVMLFRAVVCRLWRWACSVAKCVDSCRWGTDSFRTRQRPTGVLHSCAPLS